MYSKNSHDSNGFSYLRTSPSMNISLSSKVLIVKVFFLFVLVFSLFSSPKQANAGFFSGIVSKVFGAETEVVENNKNEDSVVHNSQTVPLLEASVNPDVKNSAIAPVVPIVEDGALLSFNGPLGIDTELESYASSEKISVYVVKKGDTIEGIAKKFGMSKTALLALNNDIKATSTLKIGQKITIMPTKKEVLVAEKKAVVENQKENSVVKPLVKSTNSAIPVVAQNITPVVTLLEQAPSQDAVSIEDSHDDSDLVSSVSSDTSENTKPVEAEKPVGTISGGYIWPFPSGVGRISQGLHADMAYDFAAPKGTPIYALNDGVILLARGTGYNGGFGLYVVMDFVDGRQAILGHMSKVVAVAGSSVKKGDIIGYVGSTGKSTGPHVHIGFHGELSNPYAGLRVNSTQIENHD